MKAPTLGHGDCFIGPLNFEQRNLGNGSGLFAPKYPARNEHTWITDGGVSCI